MKPVSSPNTSRGGTNPPVKPKEPQMAQTPGNERTGTSRRGFASMDPARQREIARKGGASVPAEKRSFSQDRTLAADAGRKGGEASHGSRSKRQNGVRGQTSN